MFLREKFLQLRPICAAGCFGVLLPRSSKSADPCSMVREILSLIKVNYSILGFELGRPIRQSMEDVTVGEPKALGTRSLNLDQHIRQQRVALFNIMAACGYLL